MRSNPFPNKLIAFEGIDGTGKTSAVKGVVEALDCRADRLGFPRMEMAAIARISLAVGQKCAESQINQVLDGKRAGGAIQIDDFPFNNPVSALDRKEFEDEYGVDLGAHLYLLSAIFKDRAVVALLPHLNVVCDRYLYSLIARHQTLGQNPRLIRYEELDIVRPDLFYQLRTKETERMRRVKERRNPHRFDLIPNCPGSRHWLIEHAIGDYLPRIIDNTHLRCEQVVEQVMADFESISGSEAWPDTSPDSDSCSVPK